MGTWFSLFGNWETFIGQAIALLLVLGSYVGAQYIRVWRPRRRGQRAAVRAERAPEQPADIATANPGASIANLLS
jgi:high-affinity iron transporter